MENPLLLPASKGVVVHHSRRQRILLKVAIGLGIAAVLAGAADISSRMAESYLGEDAARDTFAPAASLPLPL